MKGSHHIFTRDGVVEILNLQPKRGGKAKAYQVGQVRDVIVGYGLAGEPDEPAPTEEHKPDAPDTAEEGGNER